MSEELPFIDRHGLVIEADPASVWEALVAILPRWMGSKPGGVYAGLIGARDRRVQGSPDRVGSTLVGFHITEAERPGRLVMRGSHHFSEYELIWTIDDLEDGRCHLQAETRARFPGIHGRAYRALVVGSGMHVRTLRKVLAAISRRAVQE